MMTYSNSPPFGEASSLFSYPSHCSCRTTVVIWHSRMGFPALPLLSATAELLVVNLVAQHDPQADTQFASSSDPRLAHPFLDQIATIERFSSGSFLYRMDRGFDPQIAQQPVALLDPFPQSLSLNVGVFTGDHSDVAGHVLAIGEAARVARGISPSPLPSPVPPRGWVNKPSAYGRCWACFSTCPSSSWIRCCNGTYKRSSSSRRLTGVAGQRPFFVVFFCTAAVHRRSVLPQCVIERDGLQGVLSSRSHLHPLMSVPQQGS